MKQSVSEKKPWQQIVSSSVFLTFGKIGCLTFIIAAGSAFFGWWLDSIFGTRPWLMLILFIVSVPFSMVAIYLVAKSTVSLPTEVEEQPKNSEEDQQRDETS